MKSPGGEDPAQGGAIHVASLLAVHDVLATTRAGHLVSVLHAPGLMPTPHWIEPARHLRISCHDIVEEGLGVVAPAEQHVRELIGFLSAAGWVVLTISLHKLLLARVRAHGSDVVDRMIVAERSAAACCREVL